MMFSKGKLLGILSAGMAAIALALLIQGKPIAYFVVAIETPEGSGSELFSLELVVTQSSQGTPRSDLVLSQLVRAKQATRVPLPEGCCEPDSQLSIRIDHPGYRSQERLLGLYDDLTETKTYSVTPVKLSHWLEQLNSIGFMEAQTHIDRANTYLDHLNRQSIGIASALDPQDTNNGLRVLIRDAEFLSSTERSWSEAIQTEKILALREDYQHLKNRLFKAPASVQGDILEVMPPPLYRDE
jgi:hypothetical protein